MALMLDTNALLWWAYEPERLPVSVINALRQANIYVSVASIWEIQSKQQQQRVSGSFPVSDESDLEQLIRTQTADGIVFVDIRMHHVRTMARLLWHHKDPFDRILIATAIAERWSLISSDARFGDYIVDGLDLWQI